MFHLILAVISIALVSAVALATLNYMPAWQKPAADIAFATRDALVRIDGAYQIVAQMNGGTAPDPSGTPTSAFQDILVTPVLKFTPAAPLNYKWTYNKFSDPGNPSSVYNGLHFVCLMPKTSGGTANMAVQQGMLRAASVFSADQAFVADSCGSTSHANTAAPVLTLFLVAAPVNSL